MHTTPREAAQRCDQLRLDIRAYPWEPITGSLIVTSSVGVTTAVGGSGTLSAVLARADQNLYAAKHAGRDQVVTDMEADFRTARPVHVSAAGARMS